MSDKRVRVIAGERVLWMTLLASRVILNDFARNRKQWPGPNRQTHCKHGHLLEGENVKHYRYNGYSHRTCMACVNRRNAEKALCR